jgi:putative phage-type endonuclease
MTPYPLHTPTIVPFEDREAWHGLRQRTIGGSEVAALFEAVAQESPVEDGESYEEDGQPVSPYSSPFSLWALKTGRIKRKETTNNRIRWGQLLEQTVADEVARARGWKIRKPPGYYLHPTVEGMGASLDLEIDEGDGVWRPLEVKTVASTEVHKWRNATGDYFPPMHLHLQVQHQLAVTGLGHAWIAVLFGGSEERVIRIARDEELIGHIEQAVAAFWRDIDAGVEPTPDEARDLDVLKRLYAHADPAKVLDWRQDDEMRAVVTEYVALGKDISARQKERDRLLARIRIRLRDASAADLGDLLVKANQMPASEMLVRKEAHTVIRTSKPKARHQGSPLARIHAAGQD